MAVPRYEDRVHSGVGQSSAFICSSLALFGLEHKAEFTRPFRFERIGFARSFRSDALVCMTTPGSGVAVWSLLHFGDGREVDATSRHQRGRTYINWPETATRTVTSIHGGIIYFSEVRHDWRPPRDRCRFERFAGWAKREVRLSLSGAPGQTASTTATTSAYLPAQIG